MKYTFNLFRILCNTQELFSKQLHVERTLKVERSIELGEVHTSLAMISSFAEISYSRFLKVIGGNIIITDAMNKKKCTELLL